MEFLILSFAVAAAIQAIFFIVFIIAFDRDRLNKKTIRLSTESPAVSILIAAHDEEENLRELIPVLQAQNYPNFEVVVINDRSNDGTYDYLREVSLTDSRIRVVNVDHKPEHMNAKKYALTLGIKSAKFDWVLLTDADCRPATDQWIARMSSKFGDGVQFVLGYSPYKRQPGLLNLFIRFETLLTGMLSIGMAALGRPYMGVGRNLAYQKKIFLDNKGFGDHLHVTGGDDDLFVNRHATGENTVVSVGRDALVFSKPKTSLSDFIRQKIRHLSVGRRYRGRDKFLLGLFLITYLLSWITCIIILCIKWDFYWIAGLMLFRITLFSATVAVASERLGDKFESWYVPLLDFLFAIYYISTGPVALLTKKIRWTT